MQIQIIGDNIDINETVRNIINIHLEEPLDRILEDFADDIKQATIKIFKDRSPGPKEFKVNFDMWLPGKTHIYAEKSEDTFEKTVVDLREAVEHQIKKYKGSLKNY